MVVDPDGHPVPRCAVAVASRADEVPGVAPTLLGAPIVTTADRRGRFRVVAVPPGRYRLGVTAFERGPGNARTTGADDVPAGSVHGTVVDDEGAPVQAAVRAVPGEMSVPVRIAGCDQGGRFDVGGLDARWGYTLTLCAPGRVPATVDYVSVGRDDLRVVLRRGLTVSGRVTYADGRFAVTGFAAGGVRVTVDLSHGSADRHRRTARSALQPKGPKASLLVLHSTQRGRNPPTEGARGVARTARVAANRRVARRSRALVVHGSEQLACDSGDPCGRWPGCHGNALDTQ